MQARDFVRPGDALLYNSGGFVGWAIRVKTWHRIVHCEGYVGGGQSVAARGPQDGTGGVGRWDLRLEGLVAILRPIPPFNLAAAMAWFATVDGQKYDILGLFRFYGLGWGSKNKQICSAFLTRWQRKGGVEPFQSDEDAHNIAPFQFLTSPVYDHFVVAGDGEVSPAVSVEPV